MRTNSVLRAALALAACLPIATVALAGPPQKAAPKKGSAAPTTIKCAVQTGDTVDIKAATAAKHYADYKGNRYYFCCPDCPTAFKANPEKYAKNAHVKTPAAPVKSTKKG